MQGQLFDAKMRQYLNQQAEIKHQEEVIAKLKSFNREKSIKRAESQLLEYEERLHLAARFREIESVLSAISDEARQIEKLNSRFGGAPEIERSAEEIIRLVNRLDEE